MSEEAKAIQEVAKAAGTAIEAAREVGGFIAKFVSGSLEQGISIFEDRLRYMRWERQVRFMKRSQDFLQMNGLPAPTRSVPLKLALLIMQSASLEEDDDLQDRWVALLVNAANADFHMEIRRAYVAILEQLTPLDVQILDVIYSLPFEGSLHGGVVTSALPLAARVAGEKEREFDLPAEEVVISLSNLVRLGCLRSGMMWGGGESYGRVNPTFSGKAFVESCRPCN